jgi:hypothetical protein
MARTAGSCAVYCWAAALVLALAAECPGTASAAAAAEPTTAEPTTGEPGGAIRQLASQHLTLLTDLPANGQIDALPGYFDEAFGQWCGYFGIDAAQHAAWQVRGCLMRSRERFRAAALLPADLPAFHTGFARGNQLWLDEQAADYYRRHLLLHEGTHAFMHTLVGGVGPAWYAEGMAELLATHELLGDELRLGVFPSDAREVSKWGRVEIVQAAFAERRAWTLSKLLLWDGSAKRESDMYGWCWALAALLDGHPRYRERFRSLRSHVAKPGFNEHFRQLFADDWARLNEDWQLFVANMDYGYDFERMEIDAGPDPQPTGAPARASVAADRGWQASGIRVEAGRGYRLSARGRYQLSGGVKPWTCEPGGITLRYYHGQPLGILLAAVRATQGEPEGTSGLIKPRVVGLGCELTPSVSGMLYFRINDSAGSLRDNAGQLEVDVDSVAR